MNMRGSIILYTVAMQKAAWLLTRIIFFAARMQETKKKSKA